MNQNHINKKSADIISNKFGAYKKNTMDNSYLLNIKVKQNKDPFSLTISFSNINIKYSIDDSIINITLKI
jgi:hypothetical protein